MEAGQQAADSEKKKRPTRRRRRRGRSRPRSRSGGDLLPLHQRSTSHFKAPDRRRGERYFSQGRVNLEVEGQRARARVLGTERATYAVGLDWSRVESDRKLHVFCECERFAGGSPCKHIWATLLQLGSEFPEAQPAGKDRVGLRRDRAASWNDLEISSDSIETRKRPRAANVHQARSRGGGPRNWRSHLDSVQDEIERATDRKPQPASEITSEDQTVDLLINTTSSAEAGNLIVDVFARRQTQNGKPGKLRRIGLDLAELGDLLNHPVSLPADDSGACDKVAVVAALADEPQRAPSKNQSRSRRGKRPPENAAHKNGNLFRRFGLPRPVYSALLPQLCDSGRLRLWDGRRLGDPKPLSWDEGSPWRFSLHLEFAAASRMRLRGLLERGKETLPVSKVQLVLPGSTNGSGPKRSASDDSGPSEDRDLGTLLFLDDSIGRLEIQTASDLPWLDLLIKEGDIVFPEEDLAEAVTSLLEMPDLPHLEAPEEFQLSKAVTRPQPRLVLEPEDTPEWMNPQLVAEVYFRYGDVLVSVADDRPAIIDFENHSFVRRDMELEDAALVRLLELGLKPASSGHEDHLEVDPRELPTIAEPLLRDGWEVEARGTSIRSGSPPALRVESGVDWFELNGQVDFDGDAVDFSRILDAISKGERTVKLDDGSEGLLPSEWVDTYDSLAQLAHGSSDNGLRFLPSQALLVDALLVAMPPVDVDRAFADLREKLQTFESIKPKKEPRGFGGTLRSYQQVGLGWLCFLREFGLGGILADDMGLGKTVQALALLKSFRTPSKSSGLPYLVVAPRSLVYNWIDEAARFTPQLRVVEYSGSDRESLQGRLKEYDIVVTTYGTLRRDVAFLATVEFDTVILDEAQAIKNPESHTAKASRLLNARNRLALTGTPIENHLGELGSIFEFLNPGLLGRLPALDVLASGREASQQELALVAKGIRPFILRRTKEEVLTDLPEKTEQILHCALGREQRELYDQLSATYRESLLEQVESKGIGGSTMQVLEALLRLRQVACHPGLVDESWEAAGSAKIDVLFEQAREVLSEGHKVVVFSQFTSLLAYVRERLDAEGANYAYLDGQTRDRKGIVERFQTDPDCNLFLISLKAGGVGLNLTAASYVFLLDPWWNPAVEAQAIDRTHRIGQTQKVFAYRLIASDTVEEKMVELQASKRKLADAILDGEGGTSLKDLTADDLRVLLS